MPSDDAITFLKMAAIQIRQIAECKQEPNKNAAMLAHVARQCARQADELETERALARKRSTEATKPTPAATRMIAGPRRLNS